MRRKDRENNEQAFVDGVLEEAEHLFLALHAGQYPYCLPLNFVKQENRIYIHAARQGRKLDCIRQNPHVAFSAACAVSIDREAATTYYKSVCGEAVASIVEDEGEKGRALDALARRYQALCQQPAPLKDIRRVAIIRLDIQSISGKCSMPERETNQAKRL